jgi:hypothetical protein
VIGAKLLTYFVAGVLLGVVAIAVAVAVAAPWLSARGFTVELGSDNAVRIMVGGIIASGIWGIIGVGVGALLRNQVAAVVGIVLYRFLIEGILSAIPKVQNAYPYLPGGATASLLQGVDTNNDAPFTLLSPWVGGVLLLGYGLIFAILGSMLTVRRDVDLDRPRLRPGPGVTRCTPAGAPGLGSTDERPTFRPMKRAARSGHRARTLPTVTWMGSTHRGRGDRRRVHPGAPSGFDPTTGSLRKCTSGSWTIRGAHRWHEFFAEYSPDRAVVGRPATSGRCRRWRQRGRGAGRGHRGERHRSPEDTQR